jgi:hypothetical protein
VELLCKWCGISSLQVVDLSSGGLIEAAAGFYTHPALYAFTLGRVRGG